MKSVEKILNMSVCSYEIYKKQINTVGVLFLSIYLNNKLKT